MASRTTTDHDEIRRWVESHDGVPVSVAETATGDDPGVLRIDFPGGAGGDDFRQLSWDDWFAKFEAQDLALVYEDGADKQDSTFCKLVRR